MNGKQVFIIQKELNQNWFLYSNKFQSVEKTAALDSVSGFKFMSFSEETEFWDHICVYVSFLVFKRLHIFTLRSSN